MGIRRTQAVDFNFKNSFKIKNPELKIIKNDNYAT